MAAQEHVDGAAEAFRAPLGADGGLTAPHSPPPINTSDHVIDRQLVSWNKRPPDPVQTPAGVSGPRSNSVAEGKMMGGGGQ